MKLCQMGQTRRFKSGSGGRRYCRSWYRQMMEREREVSREDEGRRVSPLNRISLYSLLTGPTKQKRANGECVDGDGTLGGTMKSNGIDRVSRGTDGRGRQEVQVDSRWLPVLPRLIATPIAQEKREKGAFVSEIGKGSTNLPQLPFGNSQYFPGTFNT